MDIFETGAENLRAAHARALKFLGENAAGVKSSSTLADMCAASVFGYLENDPIQLLESALSGNPIDLAPSVYAAVKDLNKVAVAQSTDIFTYAIILYELRPRVNMTMMRIGRNTGSLLESKITLTEALLIQPVLDFKAEFNGAGFLEAAFSVVDGLRKETQKAIGAVKQ